MSHAWCSLFALSLGSINCVEAYYTSDTKTFSSRLKIASSAKGTSRQQTIIYAHLQNISYDTNAPVKEIISDH